MVVTSAKSTDVIWEGMTTLKELLPKSAFYGNGYPTNIIIDDLSAEQEGLHQTCPSSNIFLYVHFTSFKACGDGFYNYYSKNNIRSA